MILNPCFYRRQLQYQKLGGLNAHAVRLNCLNHLIGEQFYILHKIFLKFPCKRVLTIKPPTDIYKEENRSKLYPNFYPKFQSNFSYFCHHFGYPPINPKNSYIFHCVPFLQQVSRTFVSCTYEIDEKIGLPSALCLGILTTRKNHLLQEKLYYNNYITTRKSYTKTRKSIYFKWMKLWTFYEHEHLCNGNLIY